MKTFIFLEHKKLIFKNVLLMLNDKLATNCLSWYVFTKPYVSDYSVICLCIIFFLRLMLFTAVICMSKREHF